MRKVKFPRNLDVYEFCSKRLKDILRVPREKHAMELLAEAERKAKAEREQNELEKKGKKRKKKAKKEEDEKVSSSTPMDVVSSKEEEEEEKDEDGASAMDVDSDEAAGIGIPKDFRGNYELFALVTHKGRSSSGGHYMGYVRVVRGARTSLSSFTHTHITHSCEHRYEERVKMIGSTLMMI